MQVPPSEESTHAQRVTSEGARVCACAPLHSHTPAAHGGCGADGSLPRACQAKPPSLPMVRTQ